MIRYQRRWLSGLALAALACIAPQGRAGELDKFLPADTEVVMTVNLKQMFESGLAKKLGIDKAKDQIKEVAPVADVLKDLGFDPFKDLEKIVMASPGSGATDQGLLIVYGTFDLAKFKARGEQAAKDNSEYVKIHKEGDHVVYEVMNLPGDQTFFVSLGSKNVMFASPGKEYVTTALKKVAGKDKAGLKSKAFQALLEKMNDKQSVTVSALGSALLKGGLADTPAKDTIEKMEAIGGGLTMADDLKIEVVFSAKNADDAKEIGKNLSEGVDSALTIVGLLAGGQKEFGIVLDLLKSIKTKVDGKTVTLKGALDADAIDKALKKDL